MCINAASRALETKRNATKAGFPLNLRAAATVCVHCGVPIRDLCVHCGVPIRGLCVHCGVPIRSLCVHCGVPFAACGARNAAC
jgi:hypothetical protein